MNPLGSKEGYEGIAKQLSLRLGLESSSITLDVFNRSVTKRMAATGCSSEEEYSALLQVSSTEFQELIELVVVPETWFFREKLALDYLVQSLPQLREIALPSPHSGDKCLQLLSLGCSSGEEPYSIVMSLLDAGWREETFSVEGRDVSQKALQKAMEGVYTANSFRSKDLSFRQRYFDEKNGLWQIQPVIRNKVKFVKGNVLEIGLMPRNSYHAIFCRNVLIYLDVRAQQRFFKDVAHLLAPRGLLFVGAGELGVALRHGAVSVHQAGSCAFRFGGPASMVTARVPSAVADKTSAIASPAVLSSEKVIQKPVLSVSLPRPTEESELLSSRQEILQKAMKLADLGKLEEARALCLQMLSTRKDGVQVYYLLALIEHARGAENEAEKLFGQVVYLQPDHYEALVYLTLLMERRGQTKKAALMRHRADKALKALEQSKP